MNQAVRFSRWAVVALAMLVAAPTFAADSLLKRFEAEFVALSENVAPSVVEISAESAADPEEGEGGPNGLFNPFQGPRGEGGAPPGPQIPQQPRPRGSTGSGFIFDDVGHIVTNNHVVEDADIITVEMSDGESYPAVLVGQDPGADIAVIRVDAPKHLLKPLELADSDLLKPGQFAMAVGSPRGLTGSFSYGHITGLGREDLQLPDPNLRFQHFIQTDAAINLGNSGGPLLNVDGEVIGVNIAIVFGANSIGFAIPINRVKRAVPQLIDSGEVTRGWLGVSIRDLDVMATIKEVELEDYLEAYSLPDSHGTSVQDTSPDGPARDAGFKVDDVIRSIGGTEIPNSQALINVVSDIEPGTTTEVEIWREGKRRSVDVEIARWPGMLTARYGKNVLGMYLFPLPDPERLQESLELEYTPDFIVAEVEKGSPAAAAGVLKNDIIIAVAHEDAYEREDFNRLINEKSKPGKALLIKVLREVRSADLTEPELVTEEIFLKIPKS